MSRRPESESSSPSPLPSSPDAEASVASELHYEFSPRLVTLLADRSKAAEALRATAGEILTQHIDRRHRGLVICGVSPGVGASFLTANLAVALAESGVSTLLVDANLRVPGVHEMFRPSEPPLGLYDALRGSGQVQDVVHDDVLPNLSIVYAGAGDPAEAPALLGQDGFQSFIEGCLRHYDCTLVDCPPANQSADARRIATVVGYALIVARKDLSFVEDISLFIRELTQDGAVVIGAVLNGA